MNKDYIYYRTDVGGWAVSGPELDIKVHDKGLALAIAKFLNREKDADEALQQLYLQYL